MNTPKNRLILSVSLLILMLLGYNVAISRNAAKTQRGQLLAKAEGMPLATDCIFLGNSLVEAGCDLEAFRSAWPGAQPRLRSMNLALGGTSPVEHCLILKHALERPVRMKYLIYGFFDDQLNAPPKGGWADLVGNRALSYHFPAASASFYAPGSSIKRIELELCGRLPMVAERSSAWTKIELLRRSLEEVGMPKKKTNRYGRVDDFSGLEAADIKSFNERCDAVVNGRAEFSSPIQAIIKLARDRGAKVIFVEMPMPAKHRDTFYASPSWTKMREHLESLAAGTGTFYLSASDWITDDRKFEDATHLNEEGAKDFSAQLAAAISKIAPHSNEMAGAAARR